jgi:hypothetical protein
MAVSGCHPPATIVTEPGRAAYHADQVILRLTDLSNAVKADTGIGAGKIRPEDAFTIIEWISGDAHATPPTTGIVQIIQTTAGQGWKAAARAAWTSRLKPIFDRYPALYPWGIILDGLVEVL